MIPDLADVCHEAMNLHANGEAWHRALFGWFAEYNPGLLMD